MSITSFVRNPSKLKAFYGIRARLILLTLILTVPLMMDRVRLLEQSRSQQTEAAATELSTIAKHTADAQREIILTVQAVLKSSAVIYAAGGTDHGCAILRSSLRGDLPWIRSISVVGHDGKVFCSTNSTIYGMDLSDRDYIKRARTSHDVVISDYIFSRAANLPTIMAAYPMSQLVPTDQSIMIAAVDLQWMAQLLRRRGDIPGLSAALVDGNGVVLASSKPKDPAVGFPLHDQRLRNTIEDHANNAAEYATSNAMLLANEDGDKIEVTFAPIAGTRAHIVVSADQSRMVDEIDQSIRAAYVQLVILVLFALVGGWLTGERLIIHPIRIVTDMAERFGHGDLSPPKLNGKLPYEFDSLARAFNQMAAQLRRRERDLVATNDRLTVMASVDMVSGLANRRGLQGRLEFEWLKAAQSGGAISMIMIDVDHFKLFNDTYGHQAGDVCLRGIGEALAGVAANVSGFAARYGGEEFCLLLPKTDAIAAMEIGERVRAAVENLMIPHEMSVFRYVTASVGMASAAPGEAGSIHDLIEAADAALYAAKRRGRNTVVAHALIHHEDQEPAASPPISMAG